MLYAASDGISSGYYYSPSQFDSFISLWKLHSRVLSSILVILTLYQAG